MTTTDGRDRCILLGGGRFARDLLQEIERSDNPGCVIIGVVSDVELHRAMEYGCPFLGGIKDLPALLAAFRPDVVIVAPPYGGCRDADQMLMDARYDFDIRIQRAEDVYERVSGKLPLEVLSPKDVIYTNTLLPDATAVACNRALSWLIAVFALVALAPLMLLVAIMIKLDSEGPVLFTQQRCGLGGKSFRLFKFRTMKAAAPGGSQWEQDNRHRITRVGRWLRRFRLDEIPQFFNVLAGDMNVVGPRPHPSCNYAMFVLVSRNTPECGIQVPFYALRCGVRPGITGWAQVRYCYANNINEELEKLRFDLYYLKHYSFWLDLRILLETAWIVIAGHRVVRQVTHAPATVQTYSIEQGT